MKKERINEIWGIFFLLIGLFTLVSLISFREADLSFYTSHPSNPVQNVAGVIGAYLAFGLMLTFGVSAYIIPILTLLWSGCYFLQRVPEKKMLKWIGLSIALFSTATLISICLGADARFQKGGVVGYVAATHLLHYFGFAGSFILSAACLLLSVVLATDFLIYPILQKMGEWFQDVGEKLVDGLREFKEWLTETVFHAPKETAGIKEKRKPKIPAAASKPETSTLPDIPLKVKHYNPEVNEAAEKLMAAEADKLPQVKSKPAREKVKPVQSKDGGAEKETPESAYEGVISSTEMPEGSYQFPSVELLKKPERTAVHAEDLPQNSRILEETLKDFGIDVKVVEVEQGPVITRYELMPAPGVKVNSIAALSDDIALAMKVAQVRLIIPIPGKSAIGVEVPNSVKSLIVLRELIDMPAFKAKKYQLPLALGKDTSGKALVGDLTGMPHILIAGTTGSGKTVCVNSIILGLLYTCSPADLKFVMIDPKMVELAVYNRIPHLLTPVVTDVRKAAHTLNWVVGEMENRYRLLAAACVRNIQAYNTRPLDSTPANAGDEKEELPRRLPYIVVIIDELADLMMVAQDKVEGAITRLAQLSRAVGIHLILATQRPSVDVITGVIKANFPARVSFKVASKVDSRTVLDTNGADKLIGKGDMLFLQPGDAKPTRGQAPLVMDEEINAVVDFVAKQAQPVFHTGILQAQENKSVGGNTEKDELFDEAVSIVLETGQASTSNLQRRLRLGYTRAARIIDQMEAEGLIGPAQGAKPRDIYIDRSNRDTVDSVSEQELND